jgi:DNA-directed RNA polymerase subunit B"
LIKGGLLLDRNVLYNAYFTKDKLVHHHINSFNEFIDRGLQKVIDEVRIIETNIENTYVKLGKISIENPMIQEADGSKERLYPNDARLRNLTYASPIRLEMTIVQGEEEKEPVEAEIGSLPIMLMSKVCNLHGMSSDEMISFGEDPLDQRYDEFIEVAKVFSQRQGYRSLVIVERGRRSILEVSFPSVSGRLNFVTLLRSLGMETDMDIVKSVSDNPEIIKFMLENLEEAEVSTNEEALEKIGSRVAAGQAKDYQKKRAAYVLDRYLLPHIGVDEKDRYAKALFLSRMAEACFELALGRRGEDDKDHYTNKRLKLSGDLMEDLFRVAFNRLTRDIKYQLERASMRNRELNVVTTVRSDVLTERMIHPLATGNWVGGRTGVSQLLDRTDYMASLSHLRRVISPLSRSQPHFEARDLHATQWGRICPSETPEGPNCGLVKNFAQAVELSKGVDDYEDIKRMLLDLGVAPVGGMLG